MSLLPWGDKEDPSGNGDEQTDVCGGHHFAEYEPKRFEYSVETTLQWKLIDDDREDKVVLDEERPPLGNIGHDKITSRHITIIKQKEVAMCEHKGCNKTDERWTQIDEYPITEFGDEQ